MSRTIKEWINELPEDIKSLALKYEQYNDTWNWEDKNFSLAQSIMHAFKWYDTDEGLEFWEKVSIDQYDEARELLGLVDQEFGKITEEDLEQARKKMDEQLANSKANSALEYERGDVIIRSGTIREIQQLVKETSDRGLRVVINEVTFFDKEHMAIAATLQ